MKSTSEKVQSEKIHPAVCKCIARRMEAIHTSWQWSCHAGDSDGDHLTGLRPDGKYALSGKYVRPSASRLRRLNRVCIVYGNRGSELGKLLVSIRVRSMTAAVALSRSAGLRGQVTDRGDQGADGSHGHGGVNEHPWSEPRALPGWLFAKSFSLSSNCRRL